MTIVTFITGLELTHVMYLFIIISQAAAAVVTEKSSLKLTVHYLLSTKQQTNKVREHLVKTSDCLLRNWWRPKQN